jgi:hypothetical protein
VAVKTAAEMGNGEQTLRKRVLHSIVESEGASPEAVRVRPAAATRPLQVRRRSRAALRRASGSKDAPAFTGRNDRPSGRRLFFLGRQNASTASTRLCAVAQGIPQAPTVLKPRPLYATEENHAGIQTILGRRRSLPAKHSAIIHEFVFHANRGTKQTR